MTTSTLSNRRESLTNDIFQACLDPTPQVLIQVLQDLRAQLTAAQFFALINRMLYQLKLAGAYQAMERLKQIQSSFR
jgi:hypothetical protein